MVSTELLRGRLVRVVGPSSAAAARVSVPLDACRAVSTAAAWSAPEVSPLPKHLTAHLRSMALSGFLRQHEKARPRSQRTLGQRFRAETRAETRKRVAQPRRKLLCASNAAQAQAAQRRAGAQRVRTRFQLSLATPTWRIARPEAVHRRARRTCRRARSHPAASGRKRAWGMGHPPTSRPPLIAPLLSAVGCPTSYFTGRTSWVR
jgi:hypothetical protein